MKKGDKYIIEIAEVEYFEGDNDISYPMARIKGFSALTFDQRGLDKLEKIEDSEPVEEKELYNCKFVVVETSDTTSVTVGKIYELIDGHFEDDCGNSFPSTRIINSFDDLKDYFLKDFDIAKIKILEIKE